MKQNTLHYHDIAFTLTRKRGQKHTYLRIKSDGSIAVSSGYLTPEKFILSFIESKYTWIKTQQKKRANIPHHDKVSKQSAAAIILPLIKKWSAIMMLSPSAVGFRHNRSRWGSCSSRDRLNFNTHLASMPPAFIEYVVVHELAHIAHKNHSKAFWAEVQKYLPDYKIRQDLAKV
jgi:predicted metal-dependent hydrolase